MNNKVTLLNYDYSKWGIVQEGILGTINTYGTTLDYGNFSEESMLNVLSTLSMNRTDNREFIFHTNEYGYQQFQQSLRDSAMDLAITGTAMSFVDHSGNVSRIPMI